MSGEENAPDHGRATGACVLVVLGVVVLAVVFAVSSTAGVLVTVGGGTGFLWWAVRRPVSDSSATPPPLPGAGTGDVYAGETEEVDRVEWGPEGVVCIIHPKRVEVRSTPQVREITQPLRLSILKACRLGPGV